MTTRTHVKKAIDTEYAGCLFRSRLEARWAVFFDTLDIEWQYEPQGFELPSGRRYLPDFWLPESRAWFEVKGPKPSEDEQSLLIEFASTLTSPRPRTGAELAEAQYLKVAVGEIPRPINKPKWFSDLDRDHRPDTWDEGYIWRVLLLDGDTADRHPTTSSERPASVLPREWMRCDYGHTWIGWGWCWECMLCDDRDDYLTAAHRVHVDIASAMKAARKARFEHGQTPRMPGDIA